MRKSASNIQILYYSTFGNQWVKYVTRKSVNTRNVDDSWRKNKYQVFYSPYCKIFKKFRQKYIHWMHSEKKSQNFQKSGNSRRCLLKVTFLTTSCIMCIISWMPFFVFFDGLLSYSSLLLNKVCKNVKLNLKLIFSISFKWNLSYHS